MATSPDPPAMDRVLATTELLESILLEIADNKTLLGAQGVSSTFRNCVKTSPRLQQRLFLRAVEDAWNSDKNEAEIHTIIDFLDEEYYTGGGPYKHNPLTLSYDWSDHGYQLLPHIKLSGLESFIWRPCDETLTIVLENPAQLAQTLTASRDSLLDMHIIQPLYPFMVIEVLNKNLVSDTPVEVNCRTPKITIDTSGTLRQMLELAVCLHNAGNEYASIIRQKWNKDLATKRSMEVLEPDPVSEWEKHFNVEQKEQICWPYGGLDLDVSSPCYYQIE